MRRWQDAHRALHDVLVQVNLSGRQFLQADLVDQVADVLERTGLPPQCLALEMTETVMMSDAALAGQILSRLRALDVNLQIDDFGTGYSSLSYLHRFPIHRLKIDRSFVTGMTTNEENATIVRSINHLARELHLDVVAEGVETADELGMLRTLGCDFAQGNYFCEARDMGEIDQLITAGRWEHDAIKDPSDAGALRRVAVE
jgi:EAL domain-containing protein (putative c-di-GMP-specific phosphodiesterase class I)